MQSKLAAELDASRGGLEVLSGRWWRKRWSRDKAESAMDHLLKLLEVGGPHPDYWRFRLAEISQGRWNACNSAKARLHVCGLLPEE